MPNPETNVRGPVSRVVEDPSGKGYLEVNGKPFLYHGLNNCGAQQLKGSWHNAEPFETPIGVEWLENCFEKTKAAGFRTIQIVLKWNEIEPVREGAYDWSLVERYIDWCNDYDLYLDIVWFGANTCGGARLTGYKMGWATWIPAYLQDRDKYFSHGYSEPKDEIFCAVVEGPDADYLYGCEIEAVKRLFSHLAEYDRNRRTILFQVWNEPNAHQTWSSETAIHLARMDALARAAKESDYVVATRANISGEYRSVWHNPRATGPVPTSTSDVSALPHIDFVSVDPYVSEVSAIRRMMLDAAATRGGVKNSKIAHIAENDGAHDNLSSLAAAALVNGGFYCTFQLNDHWIDQGIYDGSKSWYGDWRLGAIPPLKKGGERMRNLNLGLHKIGPIVAAAPKQRMAGFNLEGDAPQASYAAYETLDGRRIGFRCSDASVAIAVCDGNSVYCVSDTGSAGEDAFFVLDGVPASIGSGSLDEEGNWVGSETRDVRLEGGRVLVPYRAHECLRIEFPTRSHDFLPRIG